MRHPQVYSCCRGGHISGVRDEASGLGLLGQTRLVAPLNGEVGMDSRLLIVSNRLPVTIRKGNSGLDLYPSSGGLATGLSSVYKERGALWIGWPGVVSKQNRKEVEARLGAEVNCHPVFISARLAERYYEGFSNKALWPLFHSFPEYAQYLADEWEAYKQANSLFCERITKIAKPGDTIWVHDYHLMLLPKYLRAVLPDTSIGFFLHIPFPHYDMFRLMPQHREILESLLASDLIGFHTYDYVQAFLGSARRLLGYDNRLGQMFVGHRVVQADVFPMGIDFARFSNLVQQEDVQLEVAKTKKRFGSRKLVFALSRQDYTKGIPKGLEAIEEFFEKNPDWLGEVVCVLVMVPSRQRVERYANLKKEVDALVGRINSKYGRLDWTPINYIYRYLTFEELVALYASADVALITPLRDGMNLVAKEYLAVKTDCKGVLILSEMTGAAKELLEALIVNPNNKEEVAAALQKALLMPEEEQIRRNRIMRQRLESFDIRHWTGRFLQELSECVSLSNTLSIKLLDPARRTKLMEDYSQASRRLILLDYDGIHFLDLLNREITRTEGERLDPERGSGRFTIWYDPYAPSLLPKILKRVDRMLGSNETCRNDKVKQKYADAKIQHKILSYYDDMPDLLVAADLLIPPVAYRDFIKRDKFYREDILAFAKEVDIAPGIVVGRLQHDGHIKPDWHNKLRRRFQLMPQS